MKKLFFTLALACTGVIASAQNISGSWNGELAAGLQKIPLVLNLAADGTCTLDSPQEGAKVIAATIDYISTDSLTVSVKQINASYSARLQDGELKGTFTQNGFKLPLNLKPGKLANPIRPQNPQPPRLAQWRQAVAVTEASPFRWRTSPKAAYRSVPIVAIGLPLTKDGLISPMQ